MKYRKTVYKSEYLNMKGVQVFWTSTKSGLARVGILMGLMSGLNCVEKWLSRKLEGLLTAMQMHGNGVITSIENWRSHEA